MLLQFVAAFIIVFKSVLAQMRSQQMDQLFKSQIPYPALAFLLYRFIVHLIIPIVQILKHRQNAINNIRKIKIFSVSYEISVSNSFFLMQNCKQKLIA